MGTPVSDNKPNESGQQSGTPAANAKANGTTPTVTARRPISKDEYARTTKSSPDATSVIPAVRDDQPAPAPKKPRPEVDDRPTQTFQAVTDAPPTAPKAPQPEQKKPEQKKPESKKPAKQAAKKAPTAQQDPAAPVAGVAAAGGVAGAAAAAATPSAPAPAAPAPATPAPEQKKAEPKPEQKKPLLKRPEPKTATAKAPAQETKTAPAAESASGRSARLKLSHIEPWSVTKMAFVVAVALMVVSVVAVTVFWVVLQITGVWGALNDSVSNVLADDAAAFDITDYLGFGRVVGVTLLISSLNVIFMTALATIAAHLYNLAAGILGGVELTFGERK